MRLVRRAQVRASGTSWRWERAVAAAAVMESQREAQSPAKRGQKLPRMAATPGQSVTRWRVV